MVLRLNNLLLQQNGTKNGNRKCLMFISYFISVSFRVIIKCSYCLCCWVFFILLIFFILFKFAKESLIVLVNNNNPIFVRKKK